MLVNSLIAASAEAELEPKPRTKNTVQVSYKVAHTQFLAKSSLSPTVHVSSMLEIGTQDENQTKVFRHLN